MVIVGIIIVHIVRRYMIDIKCIDSYFEMNLPIRTFVKRTIYQVDLVIVNRIFKI